MLRYILSRILYGVITVYFIATATFVAMHVVPGDPIMSAKATTPEIRANLEAHYGLDQPVHIQYFRYIGNLLKGDLGISFKQEHRSVNDIIREHFPVSASLGVMALTIAAFGGILWGSITALFRNRWPDSVIMLAVIFMVSVPSFVFAVLGQFIIVRLNEWSGTNILPVAGWGEFRNMIIPSLTLGLGTMAYITRLMRSSMLEVNNMDYIRTAKSKGLSAPRIFFKHQLRNAVLPAVTVLGPAIAAITTGGFVTESIFAIPGLGRFFVQSVQALDYTVIMGTTVFYGAFLVFMVISVDIIYGFIDPRIKVNQ